MKKGFRAPYAIMLLSFSLKSEKPKPHSSTVKTRIHPSDFRDLLFVFWSGVDPDVRKVSACKLCDFLFVFRQLLSFFHFPILLLQLWIFQNELKFGQKKRVIPEFRNNSRENSLSFGSLFVASDTHSHYCKNTFPPENKKACPYSRRKRSSARQSHIGLYGSAESVWWGRFDPPWVYFSRQQIADMIWDKFRIRIKLSAVGAYLKKWGYKRLKSGSLPAKADPEKQATFYDEVLHPLITGLQVFLVWNLHRRPIFL